MGTAAATLFNEYVISWGLVFPKIVRSAVDLGNPALQVGWAMRLLHNNIECALNYLKVEHDSWGYKTEPRPQYKILGLG